MTLKGWENEGAKPVGKKDQQNRDGKHCDLDHSGDPRPKEEQNLKSVMCFGIHNMDEELELFNACEVCAVSLCEPNSEWHLFICVGCRSTKWVHKEYVQGDYNEQIIRRKDCPNCKDPFANWDK